MKNKVVNFVLVVIVIVLCSFCFFLFFDFDKDNDSSNELNDMLEEKISLDEIKSYYNDYVSINDGSFLYVKDDSGYEKFAGIHGEIMVDLDSSYEIVDEYFKVNNSDYYVKYDNVVKIDNLGEVYGEYKYYKNYILYNENVLLGSNSKLYVDDDSYYEISDGSYPIIIKDDNRYGIEFNNRLVYVNEDDVKDIVSNNNTSENFADSVSVLNYHYVVSPDEMKSCAQSICLLEEKFDEQIKYLKDNNYYGVSLRDLELFIDGKIQLPERSVSITIDDGWYVQRSIGVLTKYQMLGTLFLIGSLETPLAYSSDYLEIHSHTWAMHGSNNGDDCPNSSKRGGITCLDDNFILDDLKKSRESLNNTSYLCYPFYDYNDRAIELLKQAGFTMAFAGQNGNDVKVGQDKFKIPRYVIYSNTSMNTFVNYVS